MYGGHRGIVNTTTRPAGDEGRGQAAEPVGVRHAVQLERDEGPQPRLAGG